MTLSPQPYSLGFDAWWAFCQRPENDGRADDTGSPTDPVTRWGFTFPTWQDARRWCGYADASFATFMAQSQDDMRMAASVYYWDRLGMLHVRRGADIMTADWCWTSGGAVLEIQKILDVQPLDGVLGPLTIEAINADMDEHFTYISRVYGARLAYYNDLGFAKVYPGLYRRVAACSTRSRQAAAQ